MAFSKQKIALAGLLVISYTTNAHAESVTCGSDSTQNTAAIQNHINTSSVSNITFKNNCVINRLNIDNRKNLTIQGENPNILLSFKNPYDLGLYINQSQNITIKDLKIDYIEPLYGIGKVNSINNGKYMIGNIRAQSDKTVGEVLKKFINENTATVDYTKVLQYSYEKDSKEPLISLYIFDSTGEYKKGNKTFYRSLDKATYGNAITFDPATQSMTLNASTQPKLATLQLQVGDIVGIQPNRGSNTIVIRNRSQGISLNNVTIYESPNVAITDNTNAGSFAPSINRAITLQGVKIIPKNCSVANDYNSGQVILTDTTKCTNPNNGMPRTLFSANKAGIHSQDGRIGPYIEKSAFIRTGDDPINMHGGLYRITKVTENATTQTTSGTPLYNYALTVNADEIAGLTSVITSVSNQYPKLPQNFELFYYNNIAGRGTNNTKNNISKLYNVTYQSLTSTTLNISTSTKIANINDATAQFFLTTDDNEEDHAVIKNSLFAYTKRGILVRNDFATIESNKFISIAGPGVWVGTEAGRTFYEGGIPSRSQIKYNTFNNVYFNNSFCIEPTPPSAYPNDYSGCEFGAVTFKISKDYYTLPMPINSDNSLIGDSLIKLYIGTTTSTDKDVQGNKKDNAPYELAQMCVRDTANLQGKAITSDYTSCKTP